VQQQKKYIVNVGEGDKALFSKRHVAGKCPWIQNITPISCTLANVIWETSANSKHYTHFVYSCQWNLGDVREFKTLHQFRVLLPMESGRRPWFQNITPISCILVSGILETSLNSKHYANSNSKHSEVQMWQQFRLRSYQNHIFIHQKPSNDTMNNQHSLRNHQPSSNPYRQVNRRAT
jgi:hypothetical protein